MQHHIYSAFGELVNTLDAGGNVISGNEVLAPFFSYTNREYDKESGLYYYRARTYDASIGRFIQGDPDPGIFEVPNTKINKYIYTLNNPLIYKDPSGKFVPNVHGNYCGYKARGQRWRDRNGNYVEFRDGNGQYDPNDPSDYNAVPVSVLDRSCEKHDASYALELFGGGEGTGNSAINLNLKDNFGRVESDFRLVRRGIEQGGAGGIAVAIFGAALIVAYSGPLFIATAGIGAIVDILESIF